MRMAEELGVGFTTGLTFTFKEKIRDEIQSLCIPKIVEKEVIGTITYVSCIGNKISIC